MRLATITIAGFFLIASTSASASAQESEGAVIIPSRMELDDEQKVELQEKVETALAAALQKCVAKYPRPELFTTFSVRYDLKKSGDLRGGYIGGAAPDSNLYVKSDEEKAKLEEEGSFARLVVRSDRDLERCMSKSTRQLDSGLDRYSAEIDATYTVAWKAKKPSLTATTFEITKK